MVIKAIETILQDYIPDDLEERWIEKLTLLANKLNVGNGLSQFNDLVKSLEQATLQSINIHTGKHLLLVAGAPSTGKTHLGLYLRSLGWKQIIRHKTRPIRQDEINGVDGYFISPDEFESMEKQGKFAVIGGGEEKRGLAIKSLTHINGSHDLYFSSDGFNLSFPIFDYIPSGVKIIKIYLLPPSFEILIFRMVNRILMGVDINNKEAVIQAIEARNMVKRLNNGIRYFEVANDYDMFLVYSTPNKATQKLFKQ